MRVYYFTIAYPGFRSCCVCSANHSKIIIGGREGRRKEGRKEGRRR